MFDVFLDNGVIRNVVGTKNADDFDSFNNSLEGALKRISCQAKSSFFISTPLMLLEFVGMKVPPLHIEDLDLRDKLTKIFSCKPFNAAAALSSALELIEAKLAARNELKYSNLKQLINQRFKFLGPSGISLAKELFCRNLANEKSYQSFLYGISIDELQGFEYEKLFDSLKDDERMPHVLAAMSALLSAHNSSIARTADKFFQKSPDKKAANVAKRAQFDFNQDHQDRVDTELVHFACAGYVHESERHPVLCITLEKLETFEFRCQRYMQLLARFNQFADQEDNSIVAFSPGHILQLDLKGNIIDEVSMLPVWERSIKEMESIRPNRARP